MKVALRVGSGLLIWVGIATSSLAAEDDLAALRKELDALRQRVATLEAERTQSRQRLEVERLVVRKELIVSDTGRPWEVGYEQPIATPSSPWGPKADVPPHRP